MTSDELLAQFENGRLAPGAFRHRDHLEVAWFYLRRHGRETAETRLLDGLQAFAARAGRPDKFDARLTRAWLDAVERALEASRGARTFEEFLERNPALLDPSTIRTDC